MEAHEIRLSLLVVGTTMKTNKGLEFSTHLFEQFINSYLLFFLIQI